MTCKPTEGGTGVDLNAGPEGTEEELDTAEILAVPLAGTKKTGKIKISSNDKRKPVVDADMIAQVAPLGIKLFP